MHWLFRTGSVNNPAQIETNLRVMTSLEGRPRAIWYGATRLGFNLLWWRDLIATPAPNAGKGKTSSGGANVSSFNYNVWVILGLGEGPIANNNVSNSVWFANKGSMGYTVAQAALHVTNFFQGDYTQSAWGYVSSTHSGEALGYRGEAYFGGYGVPLGSVPDLPNFTVALQGLTAVPAAFNGTQDCNPAEIILDLLPNNKYGVGFPSGRLATLTTYHNYCLAAELIMSPALIDQKPLASELKEWMVGTNSEFVWSGGKLNVVPYGDQALTANGATYTPPTQPIYALNDFDFLPGKSSNNDAPIVIHCKRLEDVVNSVTVEYLAGDFNPSTQAQYRYNGLQGGATYDPSVVTAKDDAGINAYGLKQGSSRTHHFFTNVYTADHSAKLQLGREQIINTYEFRTSSRYILLDPMDIISLTESQTGLNNQFVRIKEITENNDGTLDFLAEEYLAGTGAAPKYPAQGKGGFNDGYNDTGSAINPPVIWEPTDQLAGDLEIWIAVTPMNFITFGGCEVWVSFGADVNANYKKAGNNMQLTSNVGTLTAPFGTVVQPLVGLILDNTNTISVDTTKSKYTFTNSTLADMQAWNTLLLVGTEYIAYENVAVVSATSFNLTALNRAGFGSTQVSHSIGENVVSIDRNIFRMPYNQVLIGKTIYFKFLSFNPFGGGRLGLADVGSVSYTVVGTALTSPLPNVANFVSSYVGGILYMDWDPIVDFRTPILYEIRKGASWVAGQYVGTYAHPHIPAIGDDNYWIKAVCQPVASLIVYSATETELNVTNSVLQLNLLATHTLDSSGEGWPGTLSGDVYNDGTNLFTVAGDPIQTNTVFLAHFDGPNNSTVFYDSVNAHALTGHGNVKIDTSQFKFGISSAHFDQGVLTYISADNGTDFAFGTGDFTIDFWMRIDATIDLTVSPLMYAGDVANVNQQIYLFTDGSLRYFNASADRITGSIPSTGAWHHVAVARAGTSTKMFLDGTQTGSTYTDSTNYGAVGAAYPNIGSTGGAQRFKGWIDELRVVKGRALWTANFTAPTRATSSGGGYFQMTNSDIINEGRLAACLIQIIWTASAQGVSTDFFAPLDPTDFFNQTDIFQTVGSFVYDIHPEIDLSTDGSTFKPWQRYQAGFYNLWKVTTRMFIFCKDATNFQGILTAYKIVVYAPTRTDTFINQSISNTLITFRPDS